MGKAELRIEIDAHLLEQARAQQIHLAIVVERALKAALGPGAAEDRAQKWSHDYAEAIASHNRFVEEHGAFGESLRSW